MTLVDTIGERISRGEPLSDADAQALLDSHDLLSVGALADDVRRRLHGTTTTFLRVFEVHFGAPPSARPRGITAGEFRIVGSPGSLDAAVAAVRTTAALAEGTPVTGFSLDEIMALASAPGSSLRDVCARLCEAGLYSVAEVPVDRVEHAASAVDEARQGGLEVNRLTVHALDQSRRFGIVASARDLQRTCGGFRTFAPLPRSMSPAGPTTGYDDVKQIALARLLAVTIQSIQVDWPLYGPKLAQVALTMGADDVDGVAALDPGTLGTRRSAIEEIKGNIRAAGQQPVERNARFEVVG